MMRLFLTGISAAALAIALSGCATPRYPVTEGYVAPPPITPKYPDRQAAAPDPVPQAEPAPSASRDSAAEAESAPAGSAAAPTPVESSSLPPVTSASPSPPAPTPAPAPAHPSAVVSSDTGDTEDTPPEPRRRTPETRYVTGGKVVKARGMYRDYVVQKGDHLDAIARDLTTTRSELIEANRLHSPYTVRPGKHLRVPVAKSYITENGDTLAGVAKRFGVGLGELSDLNDLPARGRLRPGMFIALPANYEDHGATRITVSDAPPPRPRAIYHTSPPAESEYAPPPGPYVPSPSALAAAAARRTGGETPYRPPSSTPTYETRRLEEPGPANLAAAVSAGQGRFLWPVRGEIISGFGALGVGRRNDGVDIRAPQGSEVRAAAAGEVVYAGNQVPGFGNLVLVKHAGGWVSAYAHLDSVSVHMRQSVMQGEQLGAVGQTGGVSEPQLHFEIRYAPSASDKARPLDPTLVLPK